MRIIFGNLYVSPNDQAGEEVEEEAAAHACLLRSVEDIIIKISHVFRNLWYLSAISIITALSSVHFPF